MQHIRAVASETGIKPSSPPCRTSSASRNMGRVGFRGSGFASTPTDTAALADIQCKAFKGAGAWPRLRRKHSRRLVPPILWLRWRCQREGGSELWAKPSLTQRDAGVGACPVLSAVGRSVGRTGMQGVASPPAQSAFMQYAAHFTRSQLRLRWYCGSSPL